MKYYEMRESRLQKLEKGLVRMTLYHDPEDSGGCVHIRVEDSGKGFNTGKARILLENNSGFSGRGIPLVMSLCESCTFSEKGNAVEVTYRWDAAA